MGWHWNVGRGHISLTLLGNDFCSPLTSPSPLIALEVSPCRVQQSKDLNSGPDLGPKQPLALASAGSPLRTSVFPGHPVGARCQPGATGAAGGSRPGNLCPVAAAFPQHCMFRVIMGP